MIDGSGPGVVAAAAAGLLDDNPTIFYAGTLDANEKLLPEVLTHGAQLVITDSNRKQLERWSSVSDNVGETLPVRAEPSRPDPTSVALPVFKNVRPDAESVAIYTGARYVAASAYGNPVSLTPEDRPAEAFDGNLDTAWSVAAFSDATGNWLQVRLDRPVTTGHINLVQVLGSTVNRWITRVTLHFDGTHAVSENLGLASRTAAGQTVHFPQRSFTTLRITIDGTTWAGRSSMLAASGVGFSEVRIPGVSISETIQMPSDLLRTLGASSLSHRLTIVMSRERVSPIPPRTDPELALDRTFWLPTTRSFSLSGTARISALIPDNVIDTLLGGPASLGGAVIGSNERLPGDLDARAVFAFDANTKTFWSPGFDGPAQIGAWMQASLTHSVSFDHLDLKLIADGRHSVPTRIRITTNTGGEELVSVPAVRDRKAINAVVSVPVSFPTLTGSTIRFTIEAVRQVTTINWYTQKPIVMPVGIAEIGLPGVRFTPEPVKAQIPTVCTSKLLRIDNRPIWLKISGTVGAAEKLQGLKVSGCGPDAKGIDLGPGNHTVDATWGRITGWDLDRLVLDSAPGGAGLAPLGSGVVPAPGTIGTSTTSSLPAPGLRVLASSATSAELRVTGAKQPFWLVLGESLNAGWEATGPGGRSLGAPQLIDGYANGWYVTPPRSGNFVVSLQFGPQRVVTPAIWASGATLVLCVFLGLVPIGRMRRRGLRRGSHEKPRRGAKPADSKAAAAQGSAQDRPSGVGRDESPDATPLLGPSFVASGRSPRFAVLCPCRRPVRRGGHGRPASAVGTLGRRRDRGRLLRSPPLGTRALDPLLSALGASVAPAP